MIASPPMKKRKRPDSNSLLGEASTNPSEGHQVKTLSENRLKVVQMVGTLYHRLQIGQLVLKSGEPALGLTEL